MFRKKLVVDKLLNTGEEKINKLAETQYETFMNTVKTASDELEANSIQEFVADKDVPLHVRNSWAQRDIDRKQAFLKINAAAKVFKEDYKTLMRKYAVMKMSNIHTTFIIESLSLCITGLIVVYSVKAILEKRNLVWQIIRLVLAAIKVVLVIFAMSRLAVGLRLKHKTVYKGAKRLITWSNVFSRINDALEFSMFASGVLKMKSLCGQISFHEGEYHMNVGDIVKSGDTSLTCGVKGGVESVLIENTDALHFEGDLETRRDEKETKKIAGLSRDLFFNVLAAAVGFIVLTFTTFVYFKMIRRSQTVIRYVQASLEHDDDIILCNLSNDSISEQSHAVQRRAIQQRAGQRNILEKRTSSRTPRNWPP